MTGRILQAQKLTDSFDPFEDDRPRRRSRIDGDAVSAGAFAQYARFTRMPNAFDRWEKLGDVRRQTWIDEFTAGLEGFRQAGGRI